MADSFRTLIIRAADAPLTREIAASFGPGGAGMFTTPLNATGSTVAQYQDAAGTIPVTGPDQPVGLIVQTPPTHYISSGFVPEQFGYMVPCQTWTQDEQGAWVLVSSVPGDPVAVWQAATAQGVSCTLADVEAIFASADVTEQEPFVAMARLGLKIINPPMGV